MGKHNDRAKSEIGHATNIGTCIYLNKIYLFNIKIHCVKRVQIQSFSGPYFPAFSPNSAFGHFMRSDICILYEKILDQKISDKL